LKQLSFFDEEESAVPSPQVEPSPVVAVLETRDIDAMRVAFLTWGEKHDYPSFSFPFTYPARNTDKDRRVGLLYHGKDRWEAELKRHTQREEYPGEWLIKALEHVARFDSGICEIPEQISRQTRTYHSREDEE
jgi:hypothetical protein